MWGRANKYRARKTQLDGQEFDSLQEAGRWSELRVQEQAELITCLVRQPRFELVVNGYPIGKYTADFEYYEDGRPVVEESKGDKKAMSRDAILRMKLFRALFPYVEYRVSTKKGCVGFDEWVKPDRRGKR